MNKHPGYEVDFVPTSFYRISLFRCLRENQDKFLPDHGNTAFLGNMESAFLVPLSQIGGLIYRVFFFFTMLARLVRV